MLLEVLALTGLQVEPSVREGTDMGEEGLNEGMKFILEGEKREMMSEHFKITLSIYYLKLKRKPCEMENYAKKKVTFLLNLQSCKIKINSHKKKLLLN